MCSSRYDNEFGDCYRRIKARYDAPKAMTPTSHKFARAIYCKLKNGAAYEAGNREARERRIVEARVARARRIAEQAGLVVVAVPDAEAVGGMVKVRLEAARR
jgi:hypothetical protein